MPELLLKELWSVLYGLQNQWKLTCTVIFKLPEFKALVLLKLLKYFYLFFSPFKDILEAYPQKRITTIIGF